MPDSAAAALVIILHGVNASGAAMARLETMLAPALPGVAFARPDAPFAHDSGNGQRQWFSLAPPRADEARLAAARPQIDAVLEGAIRAAGLAGRPERVALVGFSQGAIVALDAIASGRWPVAACCAFSGRLRTPAPWRPAPRTRVFLHHGEADGAVPPEETRRAAACLGGLCALETAFAPRLGHDVAPEGLARAAAIIAEAFQLPR